ncbi:MAG: hypothetical protein A2571_02695 [Candidatus Vogelbacteria bacterium RIFOXYD1_FULL_44_32]|uniref:Uncharacterized protein n=1 Tax=Candidatus Vogelbacteria bacterium RIFOXYD1_FULL_44_32 TaxID=1802438 RepID=A0A1G2QE19_9BACT|nr:MAG: hypothetical protein A2571_02695 [Candidatus Vogelbacteria bacterium RIFOXYD1_FULL_44_32]
MSSPKFEGLPEVVPAELPAVTEKENGPVAVETELSKPTEPVLETVVPVDNQSRSLEAILSESDEATAQAIGETKKYLDQHMREIQIGVLNGGNDNYRNALGQHLDQIADQRIRAEVKELLKKEMAQSFENNRKEYVTGAVAESRTFDTLYKVVGQFKQVNLGRENEEPFLSAPATIDKINQVRDNLRILLNDKKWVQMPLDSHEVELDSLVKDIPHDSGIRGKVRIMLKQEIENARSTSSSVSSNEDNNKPAGFLKKTFGKLAFWRK